MYDFYKPEDGWTDLPDMTNPAAYHTCGSATKDDGTQLIVVAGQNGSNLSETWVEGAAGWT